MPFSFMQELATRFRVDGPLEQLRTCAARGTLVITPTHSSNLDSAVLGWSLHVSGLPPVTYGAGKNLFANPFIGFFLRNLGAYRVDRRLRHALYKNVLKRYCTVLLRRSYHSLFFPGGTRARSGAIEKKLKLGLLGCALEAFRDRPDHRYYIVPATINYSITLEAATLIGDYLAEEGRQRYIIDDDESAQLKPMFWFLRRVLSMDGALVIRYGCPLDPFGNAVNERGDSTDPSGRVIDPQSFLKGQEDRIIVDPQRDMAYTVELGEQLGRAYRELAVLLPTHLLARVLFDRLSRAERTTDVYRLLHGLHDDVVPLRVALEDIARWQQWLARPGVPAGAGSVVCRISAQQVVTDALRAFRGFHVPSVVERELSGLFVRQLQLLYYYQNRAAHLAGPGVA